MPAPTRIYFPFAALAVAIACATSDRSAAPPRSAEAAAPGSTAPSPAPNKAAAPAATEQQVAAAPAPSPSTAAQVQPDTLSGAAAARVSELAKKAAPMVDAFLNTEALFTRDGKQVVMVSNRDGLPQLYVGDAARPSSPARRLLETKERVTLDTTTPDGRAVVFRSDKGADENWAIWRVNLDGSGAVNLTPGETLQRDNALIADSAPDTMYFSARKLTEASSAVFAATAKASGTAREIFRDPKPGNLTDVTRDGKLGAFVRFPTQSENYLMRLDLASGATRTLYPRSGKVTIFDARFAPDGRTIYVATDGGGEQAWLLALDADSGQEKARYVEKNPPFGAISTIAVDKTGKAIALLIDAGDRTELRLLDARTLQPHARVAMPLGQGFLSEFSEDGTRFIARWSTPAAPTDPWAIDASTGRAAPLRKEARSLSEVPQIETTITQVKAHDGLTLPMNVLLPKNRSGKLPVVVWYHGGPAGSSRIRWSAIAAFFLSQGYAWVEPNVRGSGGFGRAFEEADNGPRRLEAFKDIENTGRWAASQPWADPRRVIVFGGSYGGYTVLVGLTRMPDLWRAGVDLFGVADLKTFMATTSGLIHEIFLLEFGDPDRTLRSSIPSRR